MFNAGSSFLRSAQGVPHRQQILFNSDHRKSSNQNKSITRCAAAQEGAGSVRREVLTPDQRTKLNPQDDRIWYGFPRLSHHSDAIFRSQVTQLYREKIPKGKILDLCSSWVSHLPPDVEYSAVVGHGLNAEELGRNERLSQFFVRNLNKEPDGWALESDSFDAVLICCSVQYFQQPERVFAEIFRVLKPGGVCIVTYTHNLFYEKAVAAWREGSMYSRTQLVKQYFLAIEGFTEPEALTSVDGGAGLSPFEAAVTMAQKFLKTGSSGADPFHAVVSYKLERN